MGFNSEVVLASLCVLVFLHGACEGFSGWDVTPACNSMTPGHVVLRGRQRSEAPYQLLTRLNKDGTVAVAVRASVAVPNNGFKGFLLQARNGNKKRVGKFTPTEDGLSRAINCDYEGGAIQHSNGSNKTQVISNWNPGRFTGAMQFRLTVVKSYNTFWTDIVSDVLNIV